MSSDSKNIDYPTQTMTEKSNKWTDYFGRPLKEYRTTADANQTFDRYDLPEAYKGKNLFLANTIEGFVLKDEDLLWTRQILPLVRTDQLRVQFSTWDFSETLAGRVPHEGISRIIRSRKSEHSGSMERRGLAFILEHGFMKTEEGRRQYMLNIQQIAQAIQVTLNFDVLSALLTCKRYDIQWMREHGYFRDQLPEIIKREVSMFGIIQKDINGFDIAIEEYKKQLSRYSVAPDTLIMPSKLQMYIPMVPEEKILYKNRGDLAVKQFEAGPIKSFRGIKVFEAKSFDLGNGELPVNLMASNEQIGQHNIMALDENVKPEDFRSEQRNIMIYDAATDKFEAISYLDAVQNSMRFAPDGSLSDDHDMVLSENSGHMDHSDVFMYWDDQTNAWKKTKMFGQMHKGAGQDFLSKSLIQKVVKSLKKNLPARTLAAFEDGCLLIEEKKRAVQQGKTYSEMLMWSKEGSEEQKKRAGAFLNAFDKIYRALKQAFPKAAILNLEVGSENNPSPIAEKLGLVSARLTTPKEWRMAGVYLALFGEPEEDLEVFMEAGTAPEASGAPMSAEDLEKAHQMNIKALGHSKALDSSLYTDAVAKYDAGTEMHRYLVTGVAHLIGQHVDDLENELLANTYGMLSKVNGRPANDKKRLERMGLVSADATKPLMSNTGGKRTLHSGSPGFIGSPLHAMLSSSAAATRSDEYMPDDMEARAASIFSRKSKAAKIGSMAEIEEAAPGDNEEFTTKNFVDRVTMVGAMADTVDHLIGLALLTSLIHQDTLESMHANDVIVPLDVLLVRPFMEFEMNHGILTKSGRSTGATYVGHSDFQLGDDVQSKLHYGNYTFYAKALVTNPKNVVLLKNIFISNYLGGFNTQFWNADNGGLQDKHEEIFSMSDRPSIFSMLIPCGSANRRTVVGADPVDIRSKFPYYASLLKMEGLEDPTYDEDFFEPNSQSSLNAMCYQGMQYGYDAATKQYSKVTLGTGHLGQNVYPGVRQVYQGSMKYLEKKNYVQSF